MACMAWAGEKESGAVSVCNQLLVQMRRRPGRRSWARVIGWRQWRYGVAREAMA